MMTQCLKDAIKYKTIVDEFDEAIKAGEFKMYLQHRFLQKQGSLQVQKL